MSDRPAEARVESTALDRIHERLRSFVAERPAASRSLLAGALLPAGAGSSSRNDFYWLLLPEWLLGAEDERLADVLWAQYCVYCLFRAQDDVVDGDADDPHLTVAANAFGVEACRVLRRHLEPGRGFWSAYDEAMESTSHALVTLGELQVDPRRDGRRDPIHYRALSRCLTIATRAALGLLAREDRWPRLSSLLDHLAIAGQLLDDFHDMQDDLADGRYNHAVWSLTRPIFGASREATEAIIAANLASTDRLSEYFGGIDRHLRAAAARIDPTDPPQLPHFVRRFRATVDALHRDVTTRQARLLPRSNTQSALPGASYTASTIWDVGEERMSDTRVG